jgi:hypothetical protein
MMTIQTRQFQKKKGVHLIEKYLPSDQFDRIIDGVEHVDYSADLQVKLV